MFSSLDCIDIDPFSKGDLSAALTPPPSSSSEKPISGEGGRGGSWSEGKGGGICCQSIYHGSGWGRQAAIGRPTGSRDPAFGGGLRAPDQERYCVCVQLKV